MSESFRFTPPPEPVAAPEPPEEEEAYNPRARLDYLNTVNPPQKKRRWLRLLVLLLILAVLAAAGVYAYPRYVKKTAPPTPKATSSHAASTTTAPPSSPATKHFDSTNFNLGLDYPADWTVNDTSGHLTVTSPATSQKTTTGSTALVRSVMTISAKGQNLTAFDKGSGLAVRTSEKISYVHPTSAQRAQTYLAFVQYSTTPAGDSMDAIYITGDNGYQKGQYIPKSDMSGHDPLIAVTFEKCADRTCAAPTSLSMPTSIWDNTAFKTPLLTLLTSLSIN